VSKEEWCPGIQEDAYQSALGLGWEGLAGKDLAIQANFAGATLEDGKVRLSTFGRDCIIDPSCKSITINGRPVKELGAILILHYLANATEAQPTGKTVSYRQLPGGNVFFPAFKIRVIDHIGTLFHHNPMQLVIAAKQLGAKRQMLGDASVLINVLPKVPVTVIVWKGDGEVRGNANVLFDESASKFLNTEDLAAVGTFVVSQLIKSRTGMVRDIQSINTV
jgi:hypothetical protein